MEDDAGGPAHGDPPNLGDQPGKISAMGVSGMMHGYLAFDKDWNLLAPRLAEHRDRQAADRSGPRPSANIPSAGPPRTCIRPS